MKTMLHLIRRGGVMLSNTPPASATAILRLAPRRSTVRMMSQEGQIQSELMESMRAKIQTALDAQSVSVSDVQGDGRHVEIVVVSNQFEGQNSVNRQRMVYKAIWEELQDVVHAVRSIDSIDSIDSIAHSIPDPIAHSTSYCIPLAASHPLTRDLSPVFPIAGRLHGLQDPQRIAALHSIVFYFLSIYIQ